MTHLAPFARLALFSAVSLGLASACGGTSFSGAGEGGESGSSTSAGTKSTAGTTGTAGKPSGGSTGTGGSSSTAGSSTAGSGPVGGTGSGGGPAGEACTAPAQQGACNAYFERWFHDVTTGLCRPFVYGGCGGNANNYESFAACQEACPGGTPNYDACQEAADCVVRATGCCGICDGPDIDARQLTAYNEAYHGEVSTCGGADIACAPCPEPPLGQGTLKYFVPDCVRGQCVVLDLRTSPLTACETAKDCRLRNGTQCCEGCVAGNDVVAVRNDGSFDELACGSQPTACLACEPVPPANTAALCTDGHCTVVQAIAASD